MRVRSSIYWVALIALLLAANLPARAGTVALSVTAEGTGTCSEGIIVCRGCTVKIVAIASDCDDFGSDCCWDTLEFPVWELGSQPTRRVDGSYRSESIVTCDWGEPRTRTFSFSADDGQVCGTSYHEDDDQATQTVTITCIEVTDLTRPAEPICPGTNVEFQVTTSPDNLGAGLLTWTGGENGAVSLTDLHIYHADFNTPGTYDVSAKCGERGITMPVVVYQPVHEVTFLEPTGTVGGEMPIRVKVRTRCAELADDAYGLVIQREDPTEPTGWYSFGTPILEIGTSSTEDGIDTNIYRVMWDTTPLKDGPLNLRVCTTFRVWPGPQIIPVTVTQSVGVKNLSFTSADPEGVVVWKGEEFEDETLTVHLDDNDLTDPIRLNFTFYSTARDNSMGESEYDAIVVTKWLPDGLAGGTYTLHLNSGEWNVDPGLYTYEVEAIQTDTFYDDPEVWNANPVSTIEDRATYRSTYTHIWRAVDEFGEPIYNAEYSGYNDNGTEGDESDDCEEYYVRYYILQDSDQIDASEGQLWLYDGELNKVGSWDIPSLQCLAHEANDGLDVGTGSSLHQLLVPVPLDNLASGGPYRFVAHIKDGHSADYRNGQGRWALDLNGVTKPEAVCVWADGLNGRSLAGRTNVDWDYVSRSLHLVCGKVFLPLFGDSITDGGRGPTREIGLWRDVEYNFPDAAQRIGIGYGFDALPTPTQHRRNVIFTEVTNGFSSRQMDHIAAVVPPPQGKFADTVVEYNNSCAGCYGTYCRPAVGVISEYSLEHSPAAPSPTNLDYVWALKMARSNVIIHEITHLISKNQDHCQGGSVSPPCVYGTTIQPEFYAGELHHAFVLDGHSQAASPWHSKVEINDMRATLGWRKSP